MDPSDSKPEDGGHSLYGGKPRWSQRSVLAIVCVAVIGLYAYGARSGVLESYCPNPADTYYNLLVQGFRAGQPSLRKDVPPGLARLSDPYDPAANARYLSGPYNLFDLSYYHGRLYLYFGVTPALILFWPFAALTGHYLFHRDAVAIFCSLGFLAGAGLLCRMWRRYFAEVSVGVVAACVMAFGLATGAPVLVSQADVYEVPISCGYLLVMLALGALWRAFHEPGNRASRSAWLAAASAAYGLAVGARPSLLFGAVILLVPIAQDKRDRQPMALPLVAVMAPMILIGLGLMLYNATRFDSPFEFGMRYQLAPERMDTGSYFSLRHLWFNFRVYFLEPVRWNSRFPFVDGIVVPPLPSGHHGAVGNPFGILPNVPLVWLALAAPLAWRARPIEARSVLRRFLAMAAVFASVCALTVGLYFCANMRYEVDFLPVLVLLATVGIFGLERALAPVGSGRAPGFVGAGSTAWRSAARWGWGLLLTFSVAFNLMVGVVNLAVADCHAGNALSLAGKYQQALQRYQQALAIKPDYAQAHYNMGDGLLRLSRVPEAIDHLQQAVRFKPNLAEAQFDLGEASLQLGKTDEAIEHYEQALRIKPGLAEVHNNLGVVLWQAGRTQEAAEHFDQAVRIDPGFAKAHYNLGNSLEQAGRPQDAAGHYRQALEIDPHFAEAHYKLGIALEQLGQVQEAVQHYEQVVRMRPDDVEAQNRLARLRAVQ